MIEQEVRQTIGQAIGCGGNAVADVVRYPQYMKIVLRLKSITTADVEAIKKALATEFFGITSETNGNIVLILQNQ